jgi:hypothetical protein
LFSLPLSTAPLRTGPIKYLPLLSKYLLDSTERFYVSRAPNYIYLYQGSQSSLRPFSKQFTGAPAQLSSYLCHTLLLFLYRRGTGRHYKEETCKIINYDIVSIAIFGEEREEKHVQ